MPATTPAQVERALPVAKALLNDIDEWSNADEGALAEDMARRIATFTADEVERATTKERERCGDILAGHDRVVALRLIRSGAGAILRAGDAG